MQSESTAHIGLKLTHIHLPNLHHTALIGSHSHQAVAAVRQHLRNPCHVAHILPQHL